jgi:hypothetical protein
MKNYDELIELLQSTYVDFQFTKSATIASLALDAIKELQAENAEFRAKLAEASAATRQHNASADTQLEALDRMCKLLEAKLAALQSDDELPPLPKATCYSLGGSSKGERYTSEQFIQGQRDAQAMLRAKLARQEHVGVVDESDDGLFVDLETPTGVVVKRGDKLYLAAGAAPQAQDVNAELVEAATAFAWHDTVGNTEWHKFRSRLRTALANVKSAPQGEQQ